MKATRADDWPGDLQTGYPPSSGNRHQQTPIPGMNCWRTHRHQRVSGWIYEVGANGRPSRYRHRDSGRHGRCADYTLATDVANSSNITSSSWETFTATYSFGEYIVVDATDYLEIDLFADAATNLSGEGVSVDFRLDDNTMAAADQTRIALR